MKQINKLIIIGNGFDLHHGLKTDYTSFIKWYLKREFESAIKIRVNRGPHEDEPVEMDLFSIQLALANTFFDVKYEELHNSILLEGLKYVENKNLLVNGSGIYRAKITFPIVSLFKRLLDHHYDRNWVDIEMMFYEELKVILNNTVSRNISIEEQLKLLNKEMNTLKNALMDYLQIISGSTECDSYFFNLIDEDIQTKKILGVSSDQDSIEVKEKMILNFNYTNLSSCLIQGSDISKIDIHGRYMSDKYPPIFGYGDELDEDYLKMEKTNLNGFLENIKSFGYFNNSNYSKLTSFLESDNFIVYIWGHSCGLSDRTLLNMIFEHDNCVAIKPFYWERPNGGDTYLEMTHNISRHFTDKLKMRNRVINKHYCQALTTNQ